jgi:protein-disulfide isomerase
VGPTFERLLKEYKDELRVVFRHFPLGFHKEAHLAAQAAMAAHDQGKFWQYHDKLFENPEKLARVDLERFAKEVGLKMDTFKKALDTGKYKAYVDADQAMATTAGIDGTPTMVINGRKLVGAEPYEKIKLEIEAALATARKLIKEGVKRKNFYNNFLAKIPK